MYSVHIPLVEHIDREKDRINRIGDRVNHPDLFSDIKEACLNKRAFFFAFEKGFFVLHPKPGAVLVWVAASYSPVDRWLVQDAIERLCLEVGAHTIEFYTARKGFDRVAKALGYAPCASTWRGVPLTVWRKTL